TVGAHLDHQLRGIRDVGDDLDPHVLQRLPEHLPQARGVVGNDHTHGILAIRCVPCPCSLVISSSPPCAVTRSLSWVRPPPRDDAPPTPSSCTSATTVVSSRRTTTRSRSV